MTPAPGRPGAARTLTRAGRGLTMVPGQGIIHDFGLLTQDGRILAAGPWDEVRRAAPAGTELRDLGPATLAPGLVNAHGHLEMAHLAGRTVSGQGFLPWIKSLVAQPLYQPDPGAMATAAQAMRDTGTAFAADIATRSAPLAARALAGAGLGFLNFHEAIGQDEPPAALPEPPANPLGRAAWAGHALYSTAPGVLRAAKALDRAAGLPFSLHLAEHDDEASILLDGSGPFVELMRSRGVRWDFDAPGRSPVAQAETLGLLDEKTLCVHCVKVGDEDIGILARRGCAVCLCPRSNAYIGVGRAPWEKYRRAGIPLCLGTDSLASNQDLDLWAEVRFFAREFRDPLDLEGAVALATRNPAQALGLDGDYGTLAPGRKDAVSVVPPDLFNLCE